MGLGAPVRSLTQPSQRDPLLRAACEFVQTPLHGPIKPRGTSIGEIVALWSASARALADDQCAPLGAELGVLELMGNPRSKTSVRQWTACLAIRARPDVWFAEQTEQGREPQTGSKCRISYV